MGVVDARAPWYGADMSTVEIEVLADQAAGVAARPDHGPGPNAAAVARLRSIEGQVRGIARMIEDDRYCIDIVDQIAATRAALARVSDLVLRRHIETCVVRDLASEDPADRDRTIGELMDVVARRGR